MKENPLKRIWDIFSVISGVIGIVSFTEDLISWKKFIPVILKGYQQIIYFPFTLFDFNVHERIIDYIFIGTICGSSFVKALNHAEKQNLVSSHGQPITVRIFYFFLYLIFWPLGIFISLQQILGKKEDLNERRIKLNFLYWLLTIVFIFLIILIINTLL